MSLSQPPLEELPGWRSVPPTDASQSAGPAAHEPGTHEPGVYAPIAYTDRNDMIESVHYGAVVVVNADGTVVAHVGDPDLVVYPRSSLKPLQADAMLSLGLELTADQLALACASHDGTPRHIDIVTSTLADAGLTAADLQNVADLPLNRDAAEAWLRAGGSREPVLMNCSGKHAAMLATCLVNGWSTDDYLMLEHPLQQAINDRVATLADGVVHVGIDGCGAPTHAVTLTGIARSFATLASAQGSIWSAMSSAPELVGGEQRPDTILMRGVPGLIAKAGAEGVFVAALPDGRAVAVKASDGAARAASVAAAAALMAAGVDLDPSVVAAVADPVLGHGQPVGTVKACIS